jgi:hypothetical protein
VETLIALPPLHKEFDPKRFIDPSNSEYRLSNDDELKTDMRERPCSDYEVQPIRLREILVETDRLSLHGEFPEDFLGLTVMIMLNIPVPLTIAPE